MTANQDALPPGALTPLARSVLAAGEHARDFALVSRTLCELPDGTPESDTDHTVMLAWIAPALAAATEPGLDPGLVAQFALVHDAVEVFAGDTFTLRIDAAGRAAKKAREEQAVRRWHASLGATLPWLPAMISRYEAQREPEARFTRAADKLCPVISHLACESRDMHAFGVTAAELEAILAREMSEMRQYAGEFTRLLALRAELSATLVAMLRDREREASLR